MRNTLTTFATCINRIEFNCLRYNHWEIANKPFLDDYGIPLPKHGDGSQYIPDDEYIYYAAMNMVEHLGVSYFDVIDLRYDEFIRLSLIVRAKIWQEPTKTPAMKYAEEHKRRMRR